MRNRYVLLVIVLTAMTWSIVGCVGKPERGHPSQTYGTIRFYEGYDGSQDSFCAQTIEYRPFHLQKKMGDCGKNDEAKSLRFEDTPPGTVVKVYDNPDCSTGDDWAEMVTLAVAKPAITVWNFEDNDADDSRYRIRYHYQDGNLDGKVSCFIIDVPDLP